MANFAINGGIFIFSMLLFGLYQVDNALAVTYDVTINNDHSFSPSALTIGAGDTVRWTVAAGASNFYQVSSDTHLTHYGYPDPSCPTANCWDSSILFNGGSTIYSFTFMIAGTWRYHDHQNPSQASGVPGTATITVTDTRAPATVTNLGGSAATDNAITLTWTSPGDDAGNYVNWGTPAVYDIRYATSAITSSNWSTATQVSGEPAPGAAGAVESMTITGLSTGTAYYFAIKARDEVPNESSLSNVVNLTTTSPGRQRFDVVSPVKITDLLITKVTKNSVELIWTSPIDEGSDRVASYDMRYATEAVTLRNWPFINKAEGEPIPKAPGKTETMIVSSLSASTTYYFSINSIDEGSNVSEFSNVVSALTLSAAILAEPPVEKEEKIILPSPQQPLKEKEEAQLSKEPKEPKAAEIKEGDLIKAPSDNAVYIVKNGKKLWIPTVEAFNASRYVWQDIKELAAARLDSIPAAKLMRIDGRPEVYEMVTRGKRHIPSAEAFVREGHRWEDILVVPAPHGENFLDVKLMRARGSEKIYIAENGVKRHIPNAETFNTYGYRWEDVFETREIILENYKDARLVQSTEDFKVFLTVWINDLERSLHSSSPLLASLYSVNVRIYLEGWIVELKSKLSDLSNENSLFYGQVSSASKQGDIELCLEAKRMNAGTGGLELCLNTRYYGGGRLETIFNVMEEKLL